MTDQPGRTTGETMGSEQQPTEPGERDSTQVEQARREGAHATHDPSQPSTSSSGFGQNPDAAYGQREGQAEDGTTNLGQEQLGDEDTETVVTGG
jgi:hypothetical protein